MRDPFNPISDNVEYSSGLAVRGIVAGDGVRACVISTGGKIATLKEGEGVDDLVVMKIKDKEVVVKKGNELQTLVVK